MQVFLVFKHVVFGSRRSKKQAGRSLLHTLSHDQEQYP